MHTELSAVMSIRNSVCMADTESIQTCSYETVSDSWTLNSVQTVINKVCMVDTEVNADMFI